MMRVWICCVPRTHGLLDSMAYPSCGVMKSIDVIWWHAPPLSPRDQEFPPSCVATIAHRHGVLGRLKPPPQRAGDSTTAQPSLASTNCISCASQLRLRRVHDFPELVVRKMY